MERGHPKYFQLPALQQVKMPQVFHHCFWPPSPAGSSVSYQLPLQLPSPGRARGFPQDQLVPNWWCSWASSRSERHGAVELESCRSTPLQRAEHPPICHAAAHAVVLCLIKIELQKRSCGVGEDSALGQQ